MKREKFKDHRQIIASDHHSVTCSQVWFVDFFPPHPPALKRSSQYHSAECSWRYIQALNAFNFLESEALRIPVWVRVGKWGIRISSAIVNNKKQLFSFFFETR
jgi:hypothetical protein